MKKTAPVEAAETTTAEASEEKPAPATPKIAEEVQTPETETASSSSSGAAVSTPTEAESETQLAQKEKQTYPYTTSSSTTVAPLEAKAGPKNVKFFLLATPRSGSTWLSMLFRGHEETQYHGNECWADDDRMQFCASEFNSEVKVPATASMHEKLDLLFRPSANTTGGDTFVGFKWMVQQGFKTKELFAESLKYINDNDVKVIALDRSNLIRKCFSFFDMKERDKNGINVHHYYKSKDTGDWDSHTYEITSDFMDSCMGWYDKQGRIMRYLIQKMAKPQNALYLSYEDMCTSTEEKLQKIKDFLGLNQSIDAGTAIHKIHNNPMEKMVTNWNELKPQLLQGKFGTKVNDWEGNEC